MGIKTLTHSSAIRENTPKARDRGLLRRLGMGFLKLLVVLAALISGLPLILLFFVTSVPFWLSLLLVLADVGILFVLLRVERTAWVSAGALAGWVIVSLVAVALSQWFASTPAITDENGRVIPGSVATLEVVELNGSQQWVTIRGNNSDNPVVLFLAGGPGGSELVMTRRYLRALEEHFVVINWDQPGTGKSYNALPSDALTPERYVADAYSLTLYLRERFGEEKIYLLGESWGSVLGVWLVQRSPDLFHALITTGQMVDIVENDQLMYESAVRLAIEQGRTNTVENLRQAGEPPYSGDVLIGSFMPMNSVINDYMNANAHGEGTGHTLMLDSLAAQEYGLLDKIYWLLGLARTFATVYPQIYDVDFRTQATRLDVPVYLIKGRYDLNAVNSLTEEYFALLQTPHKELIWFEDSAHTPLWDEPAHFVDVMVNTVLAQTLPPAPDTSTFPGYFDAQIPAYLREYNIAGAVVAVVENSEPVHLAGYGFANLEARVPMDATQSIVHIGSAGKTFTAIAVMQLVEQGLIDLDADVTTYIDFDIPATYPESITIRHLLTHTPGFEAHDLGIIRFDSALLPVSRDYLTHNLPDRVRPPGAAIGYSNYGMALLGYVIERVSGMSLSDYLDSAILAPLAMTHSSAQIAPPDDVLSDMAVGYSGMQPQPTEYIAAFGAAPVRSTAADMANYMIANLQLGQLGEAQILQPETAHAMQTQQFSVASGLNGIGFGFYEMSRNGEHILGHLGTTNYFHTLLLLFPERQLGIFVSFNSAEGAQILRSGGHFMDDLLNHFFPQTFTAVMPPADFTRHADDYSGVYFWNNRFGQTTIEKLLSLPETVTISITDDNRLRVESGGIGRTFTAIEPDRFIRSDGHDLLVFHRDETGQVVSASLNSRAVFTLERRSWYETPSLTIATLIVTVIIFLVGLIMVGSVLRYAGSGASTMAAVGQWSALLMSLLNLAFIIGLAALMPGLLKGESSEVLLRLVLALPMIALVLVLVLTGVTTMEWIHNTGSLWMRFQQTALFIAGGVFAAVLYIWNLLGWRL